jgi:hypothetical protein
VEGFDVLGLKCKGMMDKIVVDHEKKTLQIYDLKCTWSVENFYEEYYLYRRAYIQAYVYWQAGPTILKDLAIEDYTLEYPRFIVCDSTNYMNPLIYTLTLEDMQEAYRGFTHKGRNYPGVAQIVEDLKWAKDTDTWNISKSRYELKGVVNIKQ